MRVSARMHGSAVIPRLSINRSNRFLFVQAVDDDARKTIASVHTKTFEKAEKAVVKSDAAYEAGQALAKSLLALGITKAVSDRGRFKYLGRVMKFVEGVRVGGIQI